jgi:hypothetical protein
MSNLNNSRIRVNVQDHDEKNDNPFNQLLVFELYSQLQMNSYFHAPFPFLHRSRNREFQDAFQNISMVNLMGAFFDEIAPRRMELSENEMMEIALNESLNYYKTQEKKPNIKLCADEITATTVTAEMKDLNCAICVSKCEIDEKIIETMCKHVFHNNCISEWVQYKSECPVCRQSIKTIDESPKESKTSEHPRLVAYWHDEDDIDEDDIDEDQEEDQEEDEEEQEDQEEDEEEDEEENEEW